MWWVQLAGESWERRGALWGRALAGRPHAHNNTMALLVWSISRSGYDGRQPAQRTTEPPPNPPAMARIIRDIGITLFLLPLFYIYICVASIVAPNIIYFYPFQNKTPIHPKIKLTSYQIWILHSTINPDIFMSRFIYIGCDTCVTSGMELVYFGTEGVNASAWSSPT